jgi:hypothetical protein
MVILERPSLIETFKKSIRGKTTYWYPVWKDSSLHPLNTELSFFFIHHDGNDYILPHIHVDTCHVDLRTISEVFNTEGISWVFQKKKLLNTLKITKSDVYDIDVAYFLKTGETIEYRSHLEKLTSKWNRMGYYDDIMVSIPILKMGGYIQDIIGNYTYLTSDDYNFKWYNSIYIPVLAKMEKSGIRVNITKFLKKWPNSKKHLSDDGRVYTEYNPFTVTGRPSNRHGGINFSALNKSDGTREIFISSGIFVQMDYDSYHPRIIGKLIGYDLPKESVHRWLADQYGVTYEEGKGITFQLLYGGIPEEFLTIPYYLSVQEYIDMLWKEVQEKGYLRTLYRRIPLSWIQDPNPQKVFNYQLQGVETELNMDRISKLMDMIDGTDIKFILYTYDSVLIDFPVEGDIETAKQLKNIISDDKFPVKITWGTDYSLL